MPDALPSLDVRQVFPAPAERGGGGVSCEGAGVLRQQLRRPVPPRVLDALRCGRIQTSSLCRHVSAVLSAHRHIG